MEDPNKQEFMEIVVKKNTLVKAGGALANNKILSKTADCPLLLAFIQANGQEKEFLGRMLVHPSLSCHCSSLSEVPAD